MRVTNDDVTPIAKLNPNTISNNIMLTSVLFALQKFLNEYFVAGSYADRTKQSRAIRQIMLQKKYIPTARTNM